MTTSPTPNDPAGHTSTDRAAIEDMRSRPLIETMWRRRTHRVSSGIGKIAAGSMTYTSELEPQPLTELEEALLIAATG